MNTLKFNQIEFNHIGEQPISSVKLQEKSVTITENCSNEVKADNGYDGLSKVKVDVNVATGGGNLTDSKTESDYTAVLTDGYESIAPWQYIVNLENFNATDIVNFQFTVDGSTYDFTCYKIPFPSNYFPNNGANFIGVYLGYHYFEDGRVGSALIQVVEYEGQNLTIVDLSL